MRILQLGAAAQETFDVVCGVRWRRWRTSTALRARTRTSPFASIGDSFSYVRQVMEPALGRVMRAGWAAFSRLRALLTVQCSSATFRARVTSRRARSIEAGITAIAAPIYAPGQQVIASLSITAPTYRVTDQKLTRYARLLVDGAARVDIEAEWPRCRGVANATSEWCEPIERPL